MKQIQSETEISAGAERVWQVLTDFESFPEWNPFIRRAKGEIETGARLDLYLKPPGGMGMRIRPRLLKAEANSELRWLGHLVVRGLLDGEHSFRIESQGGNGVRFVQSEVFTGVLVPLMSVLGLFKVTLRAFGEMNRALKDRAEHAPSN